MTCQGAASLLINNESILRGAAIYSCCCRCYGWESRTAARPPTSISHRARSGDTRQPPPRRARRRGAPNLAHSLGLTSALSPASLNDVGQRATSAESPNRRQELPLPRKKILARGVSHEAPESSSSSSPPPSSSSSLSASSSLSKAVRLSPLRSSSLATREEASAGGGCVCSGCGGGGVPR